MSMSTHVVGFKPPDEKWKRMKAAWDACKAASIDPPSAVDEFFDGEDPGDKPGMTVELNKQTGVTTYDADMSDGYEIDVAKLPKDVTIVRVFNTW